MAIIVQRWKYESAYVRWEKRKYAVWLKVVVGYGLVSVYL